jgi:tetratricopeptide (TPR) repeat protein
MAGRAVALCLLLAGCASLRDAGTADGPDTFEAHWRAAAAGGTTAVQLRHAVAHAKRARELQPDRVEGHYYYALNVGRLADVDRRYGLAAVAEMEPALRRAIELDERFDFAGGLRLLGILHLRTPAPPVSIGSARKGLRALERAVELFPDHPENQLYLAEALRDNDRVGEARAALQKVPDTEPWRAQRQQLWRSLTNR